MKKLIVLIAVVIASASVVSAQNWGIGGRLGNGLQVVGQKYFANDNYLEARLGITDWADVGVDISLLYTWNCFNWDWTPGNWYLDFGAGVSLNPSEYYLFVGLQGMARFGYTFQKTPLTIALDYSPAVGPFIGLKKGFKSELDWTNSNFGLSVIYKF